MQSRPDKTICSTQPQLIVTKEIAKQTELDIIGLFAAWDTCPAAQCHQLLGLWIETAMALDLDYVVHFSTSGHESFWAPSCYFAGCFPHTALSHRYMRGKLSIEPHHNPKRIRALWNNLLQTIKKTEQGNSYDRVSCVAAHETQIRQ